MYVAEIWLLYQVRNALVQCIMLYSYMYMYMYMYVTCNVLFEEVVAL